MRTLKRDDIIYPELSFQVVGLCFEVHNDLDRYRNEQQYADALEERLKREKIRYRRESPLPPSFEGEGSRRNIPDFVIEDCLVVDVKAKRLITKDDYFQMQRYLTSSSYKLGIIVNFRQRVLTPKRIIRKD